MKIRLIWDDCRPTIDRRPTTSEDIENDIHLQEFDNEDELLNKLSEMVGYGEEDLEDCGDNREKIDCLLSAMSDPGDGTPNILFLSIDDDIIQDWLDQVDGLTCSEQDVKDEQMRLLDEGPWDYEDDFDEDDAIASWEHADWTDTNEDGEDYDESLNEASSAEKKAFKDGGKDLEDYIDGKSIARIKDPKAREAAIAAKKSGREDIVKQFTGDRKENQASSSYEDKANKMAKAGMTDEDLDESLKEGDEEKSNDGQPSYGDLAWKLGEIMKNMNNEMAYWGGWLYVWPDGATKEDCFEYFNDEDSYNDLKDVFDSYYKKYHKDGLSTEDDSIVEYAHKIDAELGLPPIENYYHHTVDPEDDTEADIEPVEDTDTDMITEDLEIDTELLDDLNNMLDDDDITESCEDTNTQPDWEQRKKKVLEYYNTVKEWATDPKAKTSCNFNIGIDTLNEWLGEKDD